MLNRRVLANCIFALIFIQNLAYANLAPAALKPGDLIFSLDTSGQAQHVSIFSDLDNLDNIYHTHAVYQHNRLDPHYQSVVRSLLLKSTFKGEYQVYRNNNARLAKQAHERISIWAKAQVPYDNRAASFIMNMSGSKGFSNPTNGVKTLYQYATEMSLPNFYRRIKYAIRHDSPVLPKSTEIGSSGRGFRCAEAAILAYQVEEISSCVKAIATSKLGTWVSDKYAEMDEQVIKNLQNYVHLSEEYRSYQSRLHSPNEYDKFEQKSKASNKDHRRYWPSALFWKYKKCGEIEQFAKNLDTSLPVDSKITTAAVLNFHVLQDVKHWSYIGSLEVGDPQINDQSKKTWRDELKSIRENAEQSRRTLHDRVRERQLSFDDLDILLNLSPDQPALSASMPVVPELSDSELLEDDLIF